ncbi:MAG: hypothetical protein LCH81_05650 [Bacteroidetes bacterium]|nr:hypothetical protein [Bacteroidota bacterium]
MIDKTRLQIELQQFTGSEQIFYNPLFPKFRYTEGVKYLAKEAQCYWLLDYVFSNQHSRILKETPFQVWKVKVLEDKTATITVEDGDSNMIKTFKIEFTDFPLEKFDLWFIDGTLLLPSEY